MGFQFQEAQFGFSRQGGIVHSLGIVFRRVAEGAACGREGLMPGLEGFPIYLQGFQQVEEALLGFQGVGASVRMQEFELVPQLGDIISYGHHLFLRFGSAGICLRRWAEGFFIHFSSQPFALSGLALRSFFFAAPKKNEPKRRGPASGKELGLWPQTAFPEAGDTENGIFTIRKVQRTHAHKAGKRIRPMASDYFSRGRKR